MIISAFGYEFYRILGKSVEHFRILTIFRDRIMVTLSCLIVLASLFSQLSSNLPDSPAPKAIEVLFFFYILKLSYVFMCHTFMALLRFHREAKEKQLDQMYGYHPHAKMAFNENLPTKADEPSINDFPLAPAKYITPAPKKYLCSMKIIDNICFYGGCALDVIFLGTGIIYINQERNRAILL